MVEVEAKKVVLKNLAGEYLVPITEPYIAGDGIKIEDNVISVNINKTGTTSVIVENYKSDASWYRVWSDGWIEQGGRTNAKTITFLKPFSDANYCFQYSHIRSAGSSGTEYQVKSYTASNVTINYDSGQSIWWYACGY